MKYDKLVRDKITDIIKKKGGEPKFHIADDKEFWQKLKKKLREEVDEFIKTENEEELADVEEVMDAIYWYLGLKKSFIDRLKKKKAKERGRFKKRIILEEA